MTSHCLRRIFTQTARYGHWFTSKRVIEKNSPTTVPKFDYDWEHERWRGKALDAHPPILDTSELFQNASEEVKKLYSYEFMLRSEQRTDALQELYDKVGIDSFEPRHRDLATHITYLTFSIRNLKTALEKSHKNSRMRSACVDYIMRRKGLLRLLRRENIDRFDQVVTALNIQYKPLDPFDFKQTVRLTRKKEVRNECYQKRNEKMTAFLQALESQRENFFAEKEKCLAALDAELKEAGLDTRSVFEEVVKERQEELLEPIRQDEVEWFEKEKVLREQYLRVKAEKAERAAKKKRK